MPGDVLRRLALLGRRRYGTVFAVAGVLVVGSLLAASRLRFDTDVLSLLPRDEPAVETFREALAEFGSLDVLLIVVRVPDGVVVDPYETFVDRLGSRLHGLEALGRVDYRVGDLDELLATFLPQAMLSLDAEGRAGVEAKLSDAGIAQRVRELRRLVAMPQALALKPLIQLDPAGLAEVVLARLERSQAGLALDWTSGYFLSRDQRMLLLLARPARPPQDLEFARALVAAVEAEIAAATAQWEAIAGAGSPPPPVELAGRYLVALSDDAVIRGDVLLNTLSSLAGVLLLFLFAFRRFGPLLYAFVPLAAGLALTFGFSAVAFGALSSATSGVAALLIGLAIDFVIVSYGRYAEERRAGSGLEAALGAMTGSSGRAVVIGAITTTATFWSFGVTGFPGLRQMGYLTGTGILFCMAAVFLLLPAMLARNEDRHRHRASEPRLYLHGFGAVALVRASLRRPRAALALGLVLTLGAVALASRLTFDDSVQSMRPPDSRSVQLRDEVARRFGSGFDHMMIVLSAPTLEEVLDLAARAAEGAERLVAVGDLTGFEAVTSLVPPRARQAEALVWLAAGRAGPLDVERIRAAFGRGLAAEGLREEPFRRGLDVLVAALSLAEPIAVEQMERSEGGRRLLERYLRHTPQGWKSVVYLYPPPQVWRRQPPPRAERLAEELGPGAVLVGANVLGKVMRRRVFHDAFLAGALGFVLVALLLWLDFRRLRETLLALLPLCAGIAWMLGAMAALSVAMNFMNIFVTTMVIGIGVDYGLHMIHRCRELHGAPPERLAAGLGETAKAIALAALTTIVGFGSLSLSHYPGLRSMGLVAVLGALSTGLVAVTLLPAYLSLRAPK